MNNYFTVTEAIISVLYTLVGLISIHFVIFAVIGIFVKKKFPKTEEKLKYGIIIPTRNEEAVVANLIDSIYKNEYPSEKLHIFVICHNCTDKTAEMARKAGATVYEYNNPKECTKGFAMSHVVDRINEDYGVDSFDGFFVFDADNVLDSKFISNMNDAFVACDKKSIITSYRSSKNFGHNVMTAMYGLYFAYSCRFESRGRTVTGCTTRVAGTGFLISSEHLRNGWNYYTLSEDTELTADRLLEDVKVVYCEDAIFYDEQPDNCGVMWKQRLRWARGHLTVYMCKCKKMVKSIVTPKKKGGGKYKGSLYDMLIGLTPLCIITAVISVLQNIFFLLAPIFTDSTLWDIYSEFIPNSIGTFIFSYVLLIFSSALVCFLERKRLPQAKLSVKIAAVLVWPAFLLIAAPLQIIALFKKNVGWTPIPHTHATVIDNIKFEDKEKAKVAARAELNAKKVS